MLRSSLEHQPPGQLRGLLDPLGILWGTSGDTLGTLWRTLWGTSGDPLGDLWGTSGVSIPEPTTMVLWLKAHTIGLPPFHPRRHFLRLPRRDQRETQCIVLIPPVFSCLASANLSLRPASLIPVTHKAEMVPDKGQVI